MQTRLRAVIALVAFTLIPAPAHAELRHVRINVLGMD